MKKYPYIIIIIIILLGLNACNEDEFLTQDNPNSATTNSFWQTSQHAEMGIFATYSALQAPDVMGVDGVTNRAFRGGFTTPKSWRGVDINTFTFNVSNSNRFVEEQWQGLYTGVFRANQVLEFVPDIPMDEEDQEIILGEAHFLRGLYYFWLAISYNNGSIPLITEVPTSPDDVYTALSPREEVYAQIILDLEAARAVLPERWNDNMKGRATWGAATALLGKVYLYEQDWTNAALNLEEVINSGIYSLVDDPAMNANIEGEHNIESIFEVNFSDVVKEGGRTGNVDTPLGSEATGRARVWVVGQVGGWGSLGVHGMLGELVLEDTLNPGDPTVIARANEGKSFSTRAEATIGFVGDGLEYYDTEVEDLNQGQNWWGLMWRKFQNHTEEKEDVALSRSGINERIIRYADVLLMAAEAMAQRDGVVSATANGYLNQVRERSGGAQRFADDELPTAAVFVDYLIRYERAREFAVEGFGIRWQDMRRSGKVAQINEEMATGCFTDYRGGNPSDFCNDPFGWWGSRAANYDPAVDDFFEIPSTELLTNIALGE